MTMTRTDKIVAALLAVCAAIAVVAAFANKAEAADYSGFKMAEFKIEIEGEQKTTWHRTVEAPDECSTSDHSFGREILHFETKEPIYLTATHMPGEFNPMMFSAKQIEFPRREIDALAGAVRLMRPEIDFDVADPAGLEA